MPVQIPFPIPSHGYALNSKMRINLEFLVDQFNEFNSGAATWDTVAIGTANNLTGTLTFYNASNAFYLTFQAGATNADTTITWPANAFPNPSVNFMAFDSSGVGTWVSGSAAFAPTNATYVTMSLSSDLPNERVLTQGSGITISDGGANGNVTIANSGVTSITGTANQVIRDVATGAVTLSLPQSIATSSLVQFGTVRTTTTGDGTNPSLAVYDSNTGWYRTSNDLYQILSGSIVSQTFFADLSTRFPKVVTASMVLRDTGGSNPTVTINPPSSFTSYTLTMPTDDGNANEVLKTNGSGVLSWVAQSGSGTVNSGTATHLAYYATSTTAVSDASAATISGTYTFSGGAGAITMSSSTIAMGSNKITGLASGSATGDALAYGQSNALFVTPTLGAASATSLTFSSTSEIIGTTTNNNAAAGSVGEYIESTVSNTSVGTTGQYYDVTNIALTAGDWDVTGMVQFARNSATFTSIDCVVSITTHTGNDATGVVAGVNTAEFNPGATMLSFGFLSVDVPVFRVSLSGSATYYLKGFVDAYSSGTPKQYGRISARRVR